VGKNRKFDIVVWGASGFTGRLVCEYLVNKYGLGETSQFEWAIAGRNREKLEKIQRELTAKYSFEIPILIGNSFDIESIKTITSSTKVILTTVGPYLKYGITLVDACIQTQTHYCDLTGEVPFVHQTIQQFHEDARTAKVKIVHSCGFDSVPSDLGLMMLQNKVIQKVNSPLDRVRLYVKKIKGGVSGGTISSMLEIMKNAKDRSFRKILNNPYSLYPKEFSSGPKQPDLKKIEWDETVNQWVGPFIMSRFNSAIVRRTNALSNFIYGQSFIYDEVSVYPKKTFSKFRAELNRIGLGILVTLLYFSFTRWILKNTILPKPGEGPSKQKREEGFFKLVLIGLSNGKQQKVTVSCNSDPGYSGTAIMIAESALCLAINTKYLPERYGILTPAVAMGNSLIERLQNVGMEFKYTDKM